MSNKSRSYQFTWFNYTDDDIDFLKSQNITYLCFGKEICPTTGNPHLQGMICFPNPRGFDAVRKNVFKGTHHCEPTKSFAALRKYNQKEGDFFEVGIRPAQGNRADLEEVIDKVKEGMSARQLWIENPTQMTLYHRSFERCRYDLLEDRTEAPTVLWYYGGTGTGKTRTAYENHQTRYIKDGTMWWDGYMQQETIIIDDFDGHWPFRDLLRLLDRYPYSGQVKGGYVKIKSPFIYITCEHPPSHFWQNTELAQILRRIFTVQFFNTSVDRNDDS